MRIRKLHIFAVLFFLLGYAGKSQDFSPFLGDNYAGVSGVHWQPASIVASRYLCDVTLAGFSVNVNNNFLYFNKKELFPLSHLEQNVRKNLDGSTKYFYQDAQFQALNVMYSVHPKWSVAFSARFREWVNAREFSDAMAQFTYDGIVHKTFSFNEMSDLNILYQQQPNATTFSWREYGLTAATVLLDRPQHLLKAGFTLKALSGVSATYFDVFIDKIKIYTTDSVGTMGESTYLAYGTSGDMMSLKKSAKGLNFGFDLGFEYEWRPDYQHFLYDMDGRRNLPRLDKNKYRLKVGIAFLDIGHIKFRKKNANSDFRIDGNFSLRMFNRAKDLDDISRVMDSMLLLPSGDVNYGVFTTTANDEYFKMQLPSAISFQLDYHVWQNFYINFSQYLALRQGDRELFKVHALSTISLIPRYETPYFGVSLPVQYVQTNHLLVGVGLRLGPLWIGSNNLFNMLVSKELYNLNLCGTIKIPILQKLPGDADNDHVSDRFDRCKYEPGVWENHGCPKLDFDDDGVPDEWDECPEVFGFQEFNGCPDSDGDGVPDHQDDCPDEFGYPEFKGCPDSDGDGVPDHIDECPFDFGFPEAMGCPDGNGDGVPDHK